jgi:hypothetical protein
MNRKFIVAILLAAAVPMYAQAQNPKVSMGDAQKVVTIISGDKAKTQAYCDIKKLSEQIDEASAKKDGKTVAQLSLKIETLEKPSVPNMSHCSMGLRTSWEMTCSVRSLWPQSHHSTCCVRGKSRKTTQRQQAACDDGTFLAVPFYLRRTRLPGNPADDYEVFDANRSVVGRIMLHPQAPKDHPWFWTITAREIPLTIADIQRHANRRWRISKNNGQIDLWRKPAAD